MPVGIEPADTAVGGQPGIGREAGAGDEQQAAGGGSSSTTRSITLRSACDSGMVGPPAYLRWLSWFRDGGAGRNPSDWFTRLARSRPVSFRFLIGSGVVAFDCLVWIVTVGIVRNAGCHEK